MSETGSNSMRRREFIQTGRGRGRRDHAGRQGASAAQAPGEQAPAPKVGGAAQADAGQDGRGGDDRQCRNLAGAGLARSAAPLRLQQGRSLLRHGRRIPYRGPLQGLVRGRAQGPQADLPGHQGSCRQPRADGQPDRQAARGAGHRLHRPPLLPRPGQQPGRLAQEQGDEGGRRGHQEDRQGQVRRLLDP